jgi:hypothetical protein
MLPFRSSAALALLAVVVTVTQAPRETRAAGEENPAAAMQTTAVLSITSYDNLHDDLGYLFQAAGQPQLMQMVDGLVVQMTMGKGLVGLDTSRPLGAVFQSDGQQVVPLVYLPISDAPALLELLKAVFPDQQRLEEGLYQLTGPVQVFLRLEGGFGFAALSRDHLAGTLPDPAEFISQSAKQYDLALTVNLENLPEVYRQMLLMQVQASVEKAAVRNDSESDAQFRGRQLSAKLTATIASRLIEQGREVALGFRLSEKDKNLVVELALEAQPDSELANDLQPLSNVSSRFASLIEPNALMTFAMTCDLSDTLHETLQPLLVEAQTETLAKLAVSERLKTEADRQKASEIATRLFGVALATVDARQLDSVVTMRQSADGTITVVGTGHFAQPEQIDVAFQDAVALAIKNKNPHIDNISLNVATHKGLAIHSLEPKVVDEETKRILGEQPRLHLAFGNNATFFAVGQDSLASIERAIDSADAPAGDEYRGTPLMVQMAIAPWIELAAKTAPADRYLDLARESFSTDDRLRFALEGMPNGLRLRLELQEGFIRFMGKSAALGIQQGLGQ